MTYIPPKQCPICREVFTPLPRGPKRGPTLTCGQARCRAKLGARKDGWQQGIAKAAATLKAQRTARIAAALGEQFGVMSEREQEIYAWARRVAYMDGFNTARHARQRRLTRSE